MSSSSGARAEARPSAGLQSSTPLEKLSRFATGRVDAIRWNAGPEHDFAPRWHPRLAGRNVSIQPAELKDRGYGTRAEALAAAKEFKRLCRDALDALSSGAPTISPSEASAGNLATDAHKPAPPPQQEGG